MKKEDVSKKEKENYEVPTLEVVDVKLERNFASGAGASGSSGNATSGIEGLNNSEW